MLSNKIKKNLYGLLRTLQRYPLAALLLLTLFLINSINIQSSLDIAYDKITLTIVFGVFLSSLAEKAVEVYGVSIKRRVWANSLAILSTAIYAAFIFRLEELGIATSIKTSAVLFSLTVGYILLPSLRGEYSFSDVLISVVKGFFTAILFSTVLFMGLSAIVGAVDQLLFTLPSSVYQHNINLVYTLFAPIYFLSLMADFERDGESDLQGFISAPSILEKLLSYILIPVISLVTVIIGLYIVINIWGELWHDSLLEPMIISYTAITITIYLMTERMRGRALEIFKSILPKVLVPIALIQVISSLVTASRVGLTHGRYYAILYGVFALLAGALFTLFAFKRTRTIASLLIGLSLISVLPRIDAFTISKNSQTQRLEAILIENDMIENGQIIQREDISDADKRKLLDMVSYISRMGYSPHTEYLPSDFDYYTDFKGIFGFSEHDIVDHRDYVNYSRNYEEVIGISGYDYMGRINFSSDYETTQDEEVRVLTELGEYRIGFTSKEDKDRIYLKNSYGKETITIDIGEIEARLRGLSGELSTQEASLEKAADGLRFKLVINHFDIYGDRDSNGYNGDAYIFLRLDREGGKNEN